MIDKDIKARALQNLNHAVLSFSMPDSFFDSKAFILTKDTGVRQGIGLQDIIEEIQKESKTGAIYAKIWRNRLF